MISVTVARKPLSEPNVAQNVLRWGSGALHIDACRIEHGAGVDLNAVQRQQADNPLHIGGAKSGDVIPMYKPGGRFPANLLLNHLPGCKKVGTRSVVSEPARGRKLGWMTDQRDGYGTGKGFSNNDVVSGYGGDDRRETISAWDCDPGCPVLAMDEQSGVALSARPFIRATDASGGLLGRPKPSGSVMRGYTDTGGVSRFFKVIEP